MVVGRYIAERAAVHVRNSSETIAKAVTLSPRIAKGTVRVVPHPLPSSRLPRSLLAARAGASHADDASRTPTRRRYAPARSGRHRCSHGLTCTAVRLLRVRCIRQPLRSRRRRRTARAASSSCDCARPRRSAPWERRENGGCRARWTRRSLPTVLVRSAPTATIIRLGTLPPGPPWPPPRLSGRHRIGWAMQRVAIHPSDTATAQRVKHAPTVVRGAPLVGPLRCWRLSDFS